MQACHHFYDPTEAEPQFVVCFEGADEAHTKRAEKVIAHLKSLDVDVLAEQSVLFFKWIVLHRLSPEFQPYTEALLGFFHSKGLLKGKKTVVNPVKQLKPRYLVVFTMGGHTFTRLSAPITAYARSKPTPGKSRRRSSGSPPRI